MATTIARGPPGFLQLPGEVRSMVYDLLFPKSKLTLDQRATNSRSFGAIPLLNLYDQPANVSVLYTCKTIWLEAFPTLAKHTTLEIRDRFKRRDPLSLLRPVLLNNIQTLTVDREAFVHVTRKLLPALKPVTIVERVDSISGLQHAIHILYCQRCGGFTVFLNEGLREIVDWKWMRHQILNLADEEGWHVDFSLLWECYSSAGTSALEVAYDLDTGLVLSTTGRINDTVFDAGSWDIARQNLRALRYTQAESDGDVEISDGWEDDY